MQNLVVFFLFSFAIVSAKGVAPWTHKPLPDTNAPPSEENVFSWKAGDWVLTSKSTYAYDARGILVHAEKWSDPASGSPTAEGTFRGSWSWDFNFDPDFLLTGVRERVRQDTGWKDSLSFPLDVHVEFRTPNGEKVVQELAWQTGEILFGTRLQVGYDASGLERNRTEFSYDSGAWLAGVRQVTNYDAAGRMLGLTIVGVSQADFVYDGDGHLLSDAQSSWQGGAWQVDRLETRAYDAEGRLASSLVQQRVPEVTGSLIPNEKYVHGYPSRDVHESTAWNWSGAKWVQRDRSIEKLDARGNVTEILQYALMDTTWRESQKNVYGFDGNGNPVMAAGYVKQGDRWVLTDSSANTFDANHRSIAGNTENYSQGIPSSMHAYTYAYDAHGNVLESSVRDLSADGTILSGERLTYKYAALTGLAFQLNPPRVSTARNRKGTLLGRQGDRFLILDRNLSRNLQGRMVTESMGRAQPKIR